MADHDLDFDELADLIDLIERMIDGDPRNPDVLSWRPTLLKLKTQQFHQATLSQRRPSDAPSRGDDQ
jgi:hypothetical protein